MTYQLNTVTLLYSPIQDLTLTTMVTPLVTDRQEMLVKEPEVTDYKINALYRLYI